MQPILSSLSLTANERGTKAFVAAFSDTPDGMSLSASGTVTGASSQAPDKLTMMAALLFSEVDNVGGFSITVEQWAHDNTSDDETTQLRVCVADDSGDNAATFTLGFRDPNNELNALSRVVSVSSLAMVEAWCQYVMNADIISQDVYRSTLLLGLQIRGLWRKDDMPLAELVSECKDADPVLFHAATDELREAAIRRMRHVLIADAMPSFDVMELKLYVDRCEQTINMRDISSQKKPFFLSDRRQHIGKKARRMHRG